MPATTRQRAEKQRRVENPRSEFVSHEKKRHNSFYVIISALYNLNLRFSYPKLWFLLHMIKTLLERASWC